MNEVVQSFLIYPDAATNPDIDCLVWEFRKVAPNSDGKQYTMKLNFFSNFTAKTVDLLPVNTNILEWLKDSANGFVNIDSSTMVQREDK